MSGSRHLWAVARGGCKIAFQFKKDWDNLPSETRRKWILTLTAGWIGNGILAVLLVLVAKKGEAAGYLAWDSTWLEFVVHQIPIPVSTAIWMNLPGYAHFSIPIVLIAAVIATRCGKPLWALSILASYFMVAVVIVIGWSIWVRPRPDLVLNGALAPGFNSFPSGHIAQSIATYGLLAFLWANQTEYWGERVFILFLLLSLLSSIALGRLILGAHWPSDILAGILIGATWLGVLITALKRSVME